MKRKHAIIALTLTLVALGCGSTDTNPTLLTIEQPQIDPGTHSISQGGNEQASSFKKSGQNGSEYWVAKSGYSSSGDRTMTGDGSQTCANWKSTVCGQSWANSTYYQATYTQNQLDCQNRPSQIQAPGGAVSFLATGTWDAAVQGTTFATTYVESNVEYWAMNHLVQASDTTSQTKRASGYASFSAFLDAMCQQQPPPTYFFTAYYTTLDLCNTDICQ